MTAKKVLRDDVICDFSDLPETTCSHCRGTAELHERFPTDPAYIDDWKPTHQGRKPFVAQFDGVCYECGYTITGGSDEVVFAGDNLIHWSCR